jgi:hypothetical protein
MSGGGPTSRPPKHDPCVSNASQRMVVCAWPPPPGRAGTMAMRFMPAAALPSRGVWNPELTFTGAAMLSRTRGLRFAQVAAAACLRGRVQARAH